MGRHKYIFLRIFFLAFLFTFYFSLTSDSQDRFALNNSFYDGEKLFDQKQYQQAILHFKVSDSLFAIENNYKGRFLCYYFMSLSFLKLNQNEDALSSLQNCLLYEKDVKNDSALRSLLFSVYNHLGFIYHKSGDLSTSLKYFEQSLHFCQNSPHLPDSTIFSLLNNIGNIYKELGQYKKAEKNFDEARLYMNTTNTGRLYNYFMSLADLYHRLQQPQKVNYYTTEAEKIKANQTNKFIYLLNTALELKTDSLEYAISLVDSAIQLAKEKKDDQNLAKAFQIKGYLLVGSLKIDAAISAYDSSLHYASLSSDKNIEFEDRLHIGSVYLQQQKYSESLRQFQEGKNLVANQTESDRFWYLYYGLAKSFHHKQMPDSTRYYFEKAISLIEKLRSGITTSQGKFSFSRNKLQVYDDYINFLIEDMHNPDLAFNYVEKAKARKFYEMIVETKEFQSTYADYLQKKKELEQQIQVLSHELVSVQENIDHKDFDELKTNFAIAKNNYLEFLQRMDTELPHLSLMAPKETTKIDSALQLLDHKTGFIEYYITNNRTYVWVFTSDSVSFYKYNISEQNMNHAVVRIRNAILNVKPEVKDYCYKFYEKMFPKLPNSIQTVYISPHKGLHYLPFQVLFDGEKYLIEKFRIVNIPNANILNFYRRHFERKQTENNSVFANPKYENYPELKYARLEADTIIHYFPKTREYLNEMATETAAKKMSCFNILHFASHGFFNPDYPSRSFLALQKDEFNDGQLTVREIMDSQFKGNLVVLSACKTALGRISTGDEIVGFTRAFMYAGTPLVIASLWNINDVSSFYLMYTFYRYLSYGFSYSESLRQAQIRLIEGDYDYTLKANDKSSSIYSHPYYWAAFIIFGYDHSIQLD